MKNLLSGGTVRLLIHFLLHPEMELHLRALREHTGLGMGSLQRELARLESLGLLCRREEDGKVWFSPVRDHPSWPAFRTLVREHADPADVLRDALSGIPGIHAAFLFGSRVKGDPREDSDIDLFVLEEGAPLDEFGGAMLDAESLLAHSLDAKTYTPDLLRRRLQAGSRFLADIFAGPKRWIIGSQEELSR